MFLRCLFLPSLFVWNISSWHLGYTVSFRLGPFKSPIKSWETELRVILNFYCLFACLITLYFFVFLCHRVFYSLFIPCSSLSLPILYLCSLITPCSLLSLPIVHLCSMFTHHVLRCVFILYIFVPYSHTMFFIVSSHCISLFLIHTMFFVVSSYVHLCSLLTPCLSLSLPMYIFAPYSHHVFRCLFPSCFFILYAHHLFLLSFLIVFIIIFHYFSSLLYFIFLSLLVLFLLIALFWYACFSIECPLETRLRHHKVYLTTMVSSLNFVCMKKILNAVFDIQLNIDKLWVELVGKACNKPSTSLPWVLPINTFQL